MKKITDLVSKSYPKDEILSYEVTIIKKDSIKKLNEQYMYDAYLFSSLQEYNQWIMDNQQRLLIEKDNKIKELESVISDLRTSLSTNEDAINSILTEVIPSIIQ